MGIYSHVEVAQQNPPAPPSLKETTTRVQDDTKAAGDRLTTNDAVGSEQQADAPTNQKSVAPIVAPADGFDCLPPTFNNIDCPSGDSAGSLRNPLSQEDLVAFCQALASNDASSGAGIRTPDTRIMILRPRIAKPCSNNDLRQPTGGCCTYSCTNVKLDRDLASFIASWPSLQSPQQQALLTLIQAQNDTKGQTISDNTPQHDGIVSLPQTSVSAQPSNLDSSFIVSDTISPTLRTGPFSELEWHNLVNRLSLSERQTEILCLLLDGENDKQIARKLGISLPTLRTHLQRMYMRFNVSNRTSLIVELVRLARNCRETSF